MSDVAKPHEYCTCCRHWRVVEQLSYRAAPRARTDDEMLAVPFGLLPPRCPWMAVVPFVGSLLVMLACSCQEFLDPGPGYVAPQDDPTTIPSENQHTLGLQYGADAATGKDGGAS